MLIALAEVEDALVAYAKERTRHQALAASTEDFRRSQLLALDRYEQGYANYLDVLEAQRSLYTAQDSLAQSDQQLIDDLIAIYKALGGGWEIDEQFRPVLQTPTAASGQAAPSTSSSGTDSRSANPFADPALSIPPVSDAREALPPLACAWRSHTGGNSFREYPII